jgi:hypothetical protein
VRVESSIPVTADEDDLMKMQITSKTFTFCIKEKTFNELQVDDTKCSKYKKTATSVKIALR